MSDFPAYQSAPLYQAPNPSHVPSLPGRSITAIVSVALAALAMTTLSALPVLQPGTELVRTITGVSLALYLIAGIAFVTWLYQARMNLRTLGVHDLKYTPGWTIGAWFIPLANLVMPLLVISEIDKAMSERAAATNPQGWGERDTGRPIFVLWAVFWTVRTVATYADAALQDIVPQAGAGISMAAELGAGVCAVLLILRITNNNEKLRNSAPITAPPLAVPPAAPVTDWPA